MHSMLMSAMIYNLNSSKWTVFEKVLQYIIEGIRIVYWMKYNIIVTTANIRVVLRVVAWELVCRVVAGELIIRDGGRSEMYNS